jgi:hypothetical protein
VCGSESLSLTLRGKNTPSGPDCLFSRRFKILVTRPGPPLWSSGQSSWLLIQRSGFDSRRCQIFWEVVGLERRPLSLVSAIEEILERKSSESNLEIYSMAVGIRCADHMTPLSAKVDSRTQATEFSFCGSARVVRQINMVSDPPGPGSKNDCAEEGKQRCTRNWEHPSTYCSVNYEAPLHANVRILLLHPLPEAQLFSLAPCFSIITITVFLDVVSTVRVSR